MENEWIYDWESEVLVCEVFVILSFYLFKFIIEVVVFIVNWLCFFFFFVSEDRK